MLLFGAGFSFALNILPSVLYPFLVTHKLPVGAATVATFIAAHAATTMAAGLFAFLAVFGLREILRAVPS